MRGQGVRFKRRGYSPWFGRNPGHPSFEKGYYDSSVLLCTGNWNPRSSKSYQNIGADLGVRQQRDIFNDAQYMVSAMKKARIDGSVLEARSIDVLSGSAGSLSNSGSLIHDLFSDVTTMRKNHINFTVNCEMHLLDKTLQNKNCLLASECDNLLLTSE